MGWSVASATVHSLHHDLLRLPRDQVNLHLFVFESIIAEGAEPYVARSPIQCVVMGAADSCSYIERECKTEDNYPILGSQTPVVCLCTSVWVHIRTIDRACVPTQCHLLPSELASERVNSPKQQLPQPIGRRWDCLRSL